MDFDKESGGEDVRCARCGGPHRIATDDQCMAWLERERTSVIWIECFREVEV
jgi:hypothetical protein